MNFQKAGRCLDHFSSHSLHANDKDLGLFPGKQYVIHIGLVRVVIGKKGFCQSVVSNRISEFQKLFLVIRESSSIIVQNKLQQNAKKLTKKHNLVRNVSNVSPVLQHHLVCIWHNVQLNNCPKRHPIPYQVYYFWPWPICCHLEIRQWVNSASFLSVKVTVPACVAPSFLFCDSLVRQMSVEVTVAACVATSS
jgi:hypothetical protein